MTERVIDQLHYLEDSDDEAFISGLLLERQKVAAKLVHHDGYRSLKKVLQNRNSDEPMLVLVDLNMPVMNGTEVIKQAIDQFAHRSLVIGICSGSEDPADKKNAFEAGAQFFVNKPLDVKSLGKVCEGHENLRLEANNSGETTLIWAP